MQMLNRILRIILVISLTHIPVTHSSVNFLSQSLIEKLKQCNETSRNTNTSPADCFLNTIHLPTKSEAIEDLQQSILDHQKKCDYAYQKIENSAHTPERNALEYEIISLKEDIKDLQEEEQRVRGLAEDEYKKRIQRTIYNLRIQKNERLFSDSILSHEYVVMDWIYRSVIFCFARICTLSSEIKYETCISKKDELSKEKMRHFLFYKELYAASDLIIQHELRALKSLDEQITATLDANEKNNFEIEKEKRVKTLEKFQRAHHKYTTTLRKESCRDLRFMSAINAMFYPCI